MADNSTEIAQLESIVNGATTQVTVDGTTTRVDIAQARKRIAELRRTDSASIASNMVRPVVARINLGGAW